jgi:hypothetical protein
MPTDAGGPGLADRKGDDVDERPGPEMRHNADIWIVDESPRSYPGTIVARRLMDQATMASWTFRIEGATLVRGTTPDDPDWLAAFDSFTIDGEEPTREQDDEFSDELRDLVWDELTVD